MKSVWATKMNVTPLLTTGVFKKRLFARKQWRLESDFNVIIFDRVVTIKAGMVFDYSSVPKILKPFLVDDAVYGVGGALHDWLYQTGECSKWVADALLYEVLVDIDKVPKWQAFSMWFAVLMFGGSSWRKWRKHAA